MCLSTDTKGRVDLMPLMVPESDFHGKWCSSSSGVMVRRSRASCRNRRFADRVVTVGTTSVVSNVEFVSSEVVWSLISAETVSVFREPEVHVHGTTKDDVHL